MASTSSAPSSQGGQVALPIPSPLSRIIYWENPLVSSAILLCVLLFCFLVSYGGYSLVTLAAYLILLQLVVCATYVNGTNIWLRFQGSVPLEASPMYDANRPLISKDKVNDIVVAVVYVINASANAFTSAIRCTDPWQSFLFGLGCLLAALLGKAVSGVALLGLATIAVMTIPKLYQTHKDRFDQALAAFAGQVRKKVAKVPTASIKDAKVD